MNFVGQRVVRVKKDRKDIEDRQLTSNHSYPKDAEVVSVERVEGDFEKWWVYIKSEEFEPVAEGQVIPERDEIPDSLVQAAYDKRPK